MPKEEKLTAEVEALKTAIKAFIEACPDFPNGNQLAGDIGRALANVETDLHWNFGCCELGLPS